MRDGAVGDEAVEMVINSPPFLNHDQLVSAAIRVAQSLQIPLSAAWMRELTTAVSNLAGYKKGGLSYAILAS